jgi:hypothetical protein
MIIYYWILVLWLIYTMFYNNTCLQVSEHFTPITVTFTCPYNFRSFASMTICRVSCENIFHNVDYGYQLEARMNE